MKKLFTLISKKKRSVATASPVLQVSPEITKHQRDHLFKNNRSLYNVEAVIKQKKFFETI